MRERTFNVFTWSLHGHWPVEKGEFDYVRAFNALAEMSEESRIVQNLQQDRPDYLSIFEIQENDGIYLFHFAEIDGVNSVPVLDRQTGQLNPETQLPGELAKLDWLIVDPKRRKLFTRRNNSGISLARMIEGAAEMMEATFGFSVRLGVGQIVSSDFFETVDQMDIVKEIRIQMVEPNLDWDDAREMQNQAGPSNAAKVEMVYTSGRNESLSKNQGILPELGKELKKTSPAIEDASVRGRKEGVTGYVTARTEDSQEKVVVKAPDSVAGQKLGALALSLISKIFGSSNGNG